MDHGDQVQSITKVRQLARLLQPGCLEQGVEIVLTATINEAGADNEHFDILSLDGQHLILDLLDVGILLEGLPVQIVDILEECVFDWLLFLLG